MPLGKVCHILKALPNIILVVEEAVGGVYFFDMYTVQRGRVRLGEGGNPKKEGEA